jgi:hypothetical protein
VVPYDLELVTLEEALAGAASFSFLTAIWIASAAWRVLPNGVEYVLVRHNTRMGAAGGAVLVAEHLVATGHIT